MYAHVVHRTLGNFFLLGGGHVEPMVNVLVPGRRDLPQLLGQDSIFSK